MVLLRLYAVMDVLSRRFHGVPSSFLAEIGPEFWMPGIYLRYVISISLTDCSDKEFCRTQMLLKSALFER